MEEWGFSIRSAVAAGAQGGGCGHKATPCPARSSRWANFLLTGAVRGKRFARILSIHVLALARFPQRSAGPSSAPAASHRSKGAPVQLIHMRVLLVLSTGQTRYFNYW